MYYFSFFLSRRFAISLRFRNQVNYNFDSTWPRSLENTILYLGHCEPSMTLHFTPESAKWILNLYLQRFTPWWLDTVSLRIKYHWVHSLSKQDQNAVHNAHDQMRRFGQLTDRGDMASLDGLVTEKESDLVSVFLVALTYIGTWATCLQKTP